MGRNKPHCVLVTRFSALGDVAMSLPVVYDVCRANPDVRFVMASRPWLASLALERPDNLTIEPIDLRAHKGAWGMVRLARQLRRTYDIDAMADLHSVLRTWAMGVTLRLHGAMVCRIDKGRRDKRLLTTGQRRAPLTHTTERYRMVFRRLGLEAPQAFTSLFGPNLPPCAIAGDKPAGHRWIAVAPFAAHPGKAYPDAKMHTVVQRLAAQPHTHVFLFGGGEKEKAIVAPWADELGNVTSVAHLTHTFADELALLARCDAMVSMDSANMHLASLVGLPAVTVWGATHPWCGFLGYGQSEQHTVQLSIDCRPCSVFGNTACRRGDYPCLQGIDPEMIVEKVNQITPP